MIGMASLSSGSKGNCTILRNGDEIILIDCGISFKRLKEKLHELELSEEMVTGIFITHEHADHISGVKAVSNKLNLPVYCNQNTGSFLRHKGREPENMLFFENGSKISHKSFMVEPFSIPHDGVDTVAYNVFINNMKISVATDFGFPSQAVKQNLMNADIILLESNYDVKMLQNCDKRPWRIKQRILSRHGHLSNESCLEILGDVLHANLKQLILGHVSQDTNDYALVEDLTKKYLSEHGYGNLPMIVARQEVSTAFISL
jgi:phosphoribosyl 1,2-cyclic phosphodiesterase